MDQQTTIKTVAALALFFHPRRVPFNTQSKLPKEEVKSSNGCSSTYSSNC
jgi:hypothetical protein